MALFFDTVELTNALVSTKTSGTMIITGASADAFGYNANYGHYIAGNGGAYIYGNGTFYNGAGSFYSLLHSGGGTVNGTLTTAGGINMNNTNLTGVNHIVINDTGAGEGIEWAGGNGWKIYESGNNLDNTSGNLQFVTGSTRRMTLNTTGILEVFGNSIEINGKYVRDFSHSRYISGGGSLYGSGTSGWTKAAQVTVTGNCSGSVLYGRMYSRAYHEAEMYDIAVVIRAECDFTSNNESHFIELGCTVAASSENTDYRDRIRAVLVESTTNRRTYEIQFFETAWNDNWWELWSSGFTIYETPQTIGTAVGTPRVNYRSRLGADDLYARNGAYAPAFYDRDDPNYYANPAGTSNMTKIVLNSTGTGNNATLTINNSSSAAFNHSLEAFAGGLTSGETNLLMVGKEGNTKNSGYVGYYWSSAGSNNNFISVGQWGADHLFRVYGDQIVSTVTHRAWVDMRAPIFYDYNDTSNYIDPSGTSVHKGVQFRLGVSNNWDTGNLDGFNTTITNLHFQGHSDFWIGAGNSYWHTTPIAGHHDLIINTMQAQSGYERGITFTASKSNSAYRLGRWFSKETQADSILEIDGRARAGGSFVNTQHKVRNIDSDNYFNINDNTTVDEFVEQWGTFTTGSISNITKVDDNTAPAPGCFEFAGPTYIDSSGDFIKVDQNAEYTFECWIKYVSGTGTDCRLYLGWNMYNSGKSSFGNVQRYWGASAFQVDANSNNNGWYKVTGTISGIGTATGQFISGTQYVKPLFLINYVVSGTVTTRLCGFKLYKSDKRATELTLTRKNHWHGYLDTTDNGNPPGYVRLSNHGGDILRIQSDTGYVNIGSDNGSFVHFTTDRSSYYFDKNIQHNGIYYDYANTGYYVKPSGTTKLETLQIRPASNGAGAKINFSDHSSGAYAQNGTLEYVHSDTASYGSGNAFKFYGTESSMSFHVAGQGLFTNDVIAYYSDMRLKTKIGDIKDPIGKIQALNGFYYEPNEIAESYGYEKERRIGLSAQEVQEVVPEAVTMAAIGDDYLSVDYAKLIPVLVEAIKEQQKQIDELKKLINP